MLIRHDDFREGMTKSLYSTDTHLHGSHNLGLQLQAMAQRVFRYGMHINIPICKSSPFPGSPKPQSHLDIHALPTYTHHTSPASAS